MPVNWCPALGTVLANEEVIDGKSERGGHPVFRKNLKQVRRLAPPASPQESPIPPQTEEEEEAERGGKRGGGGGGGGGRTEEAETADGGGGGCSVVTPSTPHGDL